MKFSVYKAVLLHVLHAWLPLMTSGSSSITCVAGTFLVGESGAVTCMFGRDISLTQRNFNIVMYPLTDDNDYNSVTYILLCNWGLERNLECKVEDGYSFDKNISNALTISIHNVTQKMEGRYECHLVPDHEVAIESCNLTVKRFHDNNSPTQTYVGETVSGLPYYIIIAALSLLLLAALIYIIWRRIHYPSRRRRNFTYELEKLETRITATRLLSPKRQKTPQAQDVDSEDGIASSVRVKINYPINTVNQTTQVFVDVLDKNFQTGDPAPQTADRQTQLQQADIPKEKTIKPSTAGFKLGSSKRYNNPQYTHLGKPPIVPVPKDPTSEDIEYACELAKAALKDLSGN